eukprot:TRINITY_DN16652_c0_g1_i4.p1 TRINITY_DN16652_c0_g1~~TRINITY_DN16652_c0_g1_i4.p1  ORF type:complete len:145 (+),score=46.55 TRINITY_DN16652_c0_g1_i4:625-1059(+)
MDDEVHYNEMNRNIYLEIKEGLGNDHACDGSRDVKSNGDGYNCTLITSCVNDIGPTSKYGCVNDDINHSNPNCLNINHNNNNPNNSLNNSPCDSTGERNSTSDISLQGGAFNLTEVLEKSKSRKKKHQHQYSADLSILKKDKKH